MKTQTTLISLLSAVALMPTMNSAIAAVLTGPALHSIAGQSPQPKATTGNLMLASKLEGGYVYRECVVGIAGSDWLLVHTDITACLTDESGSFTTNPTHMKVHNYGKMPCFVSGLEVGIGSPDAAGSEVEPGETVMFDITRYHTKGQRISRINADFKFWKGPVPSNK